MYVYLLRQSFVFGVFRKICSNIMNCYTHIAHVLYVRAMYLIMMLYVLASILCSQGNRFRESTAQF